MGSSGVAALALALAVADDPVGVEVTGDLYASVLEGLRTSGVEVSGVDVPWPSTCGRDLAASSCWTELHERWLPTARARFLLAGRVEPVATGRFVSLVLIDAWTQSVVMATVGHHVPTDLIFAPGLASAVPMKLHDFVDPPPAPVSVATVHPSAPPPDAEIPYLSDYSADLKADFADFCRTGKARKRLHRDDPLDLRPRCQRGPFFGYWRRATWASLGLTVTFAAATGTAFGLRRAGYDRRYGGAPLELWGGVAAAFATASALALLGRIILDRRQAREFIRMEKALMQLE